MALTRDDWFGHWTVQGDRHGDPNERIEWDFALIEALETIDDFTDDNGLLRWEVDEDGVSVDSVKTYDKFQASIDRKTGRDNYKPEPGERWKPVVRPSRYREDGGFQTFAEWRESQNAK